MRHVSSYHPDPATLIDPKPPRRWRLRNAKNLRSVKRAASRMAKIRARKMRELSNVAVFLDESAEVRP